MTLKLKHIKEYLDHDLQFKLSDIGLFNIDSEYEKPREAYEIFKLTNIIISDRVEVEMETKSGWGIGLIELEEIMPILRPLSDLLKEIEVKGKKFVPASILFDISEQEQNDFEIYGTIPEYWESVMKVPIRYWDYGDVKKLYEWHFDVHGLIKMKLAIDVNTLNNN